MKNFLVGIGILSILFTTAGCKKKGAPQQEPLPVNVVAVIEKEVHEWNEFTRHYGAGAHRKFKITGNACV